MVFWKKEEFGRSDVELQVQELVQTRSNVVDGQPAASPLQAVHHNFAGHSLNCWLLTVMLTTLCRKKKVETCPLIYSHDWAANFKLLYPI